MGWFRSRSGNYLRGTVAGHGAVPIAQCVYILKKAGYDAVFVSGIAEKPVYIWIKDGKAEIRDAAKLWGLDAKEVWEALRIETGEEKVRVAAIGQAGENLSLYAAVINDGHRAAGRGGVGTVMGSKKLKAIAVRGTGTIEVDNREKLVELNKAIASAINNPAAGMMADFVKSFRTHGTSMTNYTSVISGDAPVKNWGGSC
jgi:aldehyde:ferredoxin oxidoreductase